MLMKALASEHGGGTQQPPSASLNGGLHHAFLPTPRGHPILRRCRPARQVPVAQDGPQAFVRKVRPQIPVVMSSITSPPCGPSCSILADEPGCCKGLPTGQAVIPPDRPAGRMT